ncbi:GTP 3',8-cyclase MoaA [Haliangium ochraceum]|uniref:GTP 3',8-cyclase n=1 Tax=Haliangium ochraceum (strain DSM 14365 / JCM 11303 / SMP-2) TaxID=502025 RepID=D0LV10_HALO1|nr:GTP 3',8-cyclase MoaA [Haliangium ochraceum]ACY15851.1 molybdenum cofactor biosynthesis protein A [Haliangium ochraceum DSM 14365]
MSRRSLPVIAPLSDGFARRVRYLRVSLTDRCNFRCTYCMPATGMVFRARKELLSFEELERLIGVFASVGVRRIRLTGGEPTVRAEVVSLVGRIARVPGIDEVVMTSNGHLFPELAQPLAEAGLAGVNISLDTLDPERFRALTRRGDLARVLAGIDAARAAGLEVKINAVALKGENDAEVPALCAYAWGRGITPRFIEHMPMSEGQLYSETRQLTAAEIRAAVSAHFGAELVPEQPAQASALGPSRYWRLVGGAGEGEGERRLGIISAMSEHFCDTCNRLRLSAVGALHTCLGYDDAHSLRDLMRAGASDDELRAAITAAVLEKRAGHQFQRTGGGGPTKHMIAIGG